MEDALDQFEEEKLGEAGEIKLGETEEEQNSFVSSLEVKNSSIADNNMPNA